MKLFNLFSTGDGVIPTRTLLGAAPFIRMHQKNGICLGWHFIIFAHIGIEWAQRLYVISTTLFSCHKSPIRSIFWGIVLVFYL